MFQIFDNNIRSIRINLPVRMDGKIPENGDIISFRNWLWVMFIPVPRVWDFVMTTNVPMQILAYSVMSSYVLCCSKFRASRNNVVDGLNILIAESTFGVYSIV